MQCHYAEIGTQYHPLVTTDATWSECLASIASCCARKHSGQRITNYYRTWSARVLYRVPGQVQYAQRMYNLCTAAYGAAARVHARSLAAPERAVGLYLQPQ